MEGRGVDYTKKEDQRIILRGWELDKHETVVNGSGFDCTSKF